MTDGSLAVSSQRQPVGAARGCGRVSTHGQRLDRQVAALEAAGCGRLFTDKLSGRDADQPTVRLHGLRAPRGPGCGHRAVPAGPLPDRPDPDRGEPAGARDVGFRSLSEAIDTSTPGGRLVFHVFASLAEFVRELIVEGTRLFQWADDGLLDLLEHIVEWGGDAPVAVLCTARPEFLERRADWPGVQRVEPLSPEATIELLGALLTTCP